MAKAKNFDAMNTENVYQTISKATAKKTKKEKVSTSLLLPVDVLDYLDVMRTLSKTSRTGYVIELLKKDREENEEKYQAAVKFFK